MEKLKKAVDPIDRYVGSRVRMQRMMSGISQEKLGHGLGLTFQQVQKYEKGSNRISASRLQQIAEILKVPVSLFFDGAPAGGTPREGLSDTTSVAYFADFLGTSEGVRLTKAFTQIKSAAIRRRVIDLVEALAGEELV